MSLSIEEQQSLAELIGQYRGSTFDVEGELHWPVRMNPPSVVGSHEATALMIEFLSEKGNLWMGSSTLEEFPYHVVLYGESLVHGYGRTRNESLINAIQSGGWL